MALVVDGCVLVDAIIMLVCGWAQCLIDDASSSSGGRGT